MLKKYKNVQKENNRPESILQKHLGYIFLYYIMHNNTVVLYFIF